MSSGLRMALADRGQVASILSGAVTPRTFRLDVAAVSPVTKAFRAMVNEQAFDISEMPLTTLAMAIEHGRPMIGIPVVLNRDFHHRSILVNRNSGIRDAADLPGRRIGVRAYSQTTGVWVRGLLRDEYGVSPDSVTWVTFEGSHVKEFVDPPNVVRADPGRSLAGMLESGELDAAAIMDPRIEHPDVLPLFPDAAVLSKELFARTGINPVNHVIAVSSDAAAAHPGLVQELFDLFVASKENYLEKLRSGTELNREDRYKLVLESLVEGDPMPYGFKENQASMQLLLSHAHDQQLTDTQLRAEELFHSDLLHT